MGMGKEVQESAWCFQCRSVSSAEYHGLYTLRRLTGAADDSCDEASCVDHNTPGIYQEATRTVKKFRRNCPPPASPCRPNPHPPALGLGLLAQVERAAQGLVDEDPQPSEQESRILNHQPASSSTIVVETPTPCYRAEADSAWWCLRCWGLYLGHMSETELKTWFDAEFRCAKQLTETERRAFAPQPADPRWFSLLRRCGSCPRRAAQGASEFLTRKCD